VLIKFVKCCAGLCAVLLLLTACKPSSLLSAKDDVVDGGEQPPSLDLVGGAHFPSGVWVDGDNTVWSVSRDGKQLRATAECGPSIGRKFSGQVQKDFISYLVEGDRPSMGEGRAMQVDDLHAYFIVSGEVQSHGLFHFNHFDVETECSSRFQRRGPIDLRPSYENGTGD